MEIITKKYDKQRTYLEYNSDGKIFTNANYFMFDVGAATSEDCLKCGGFYADMTWRHIQEKHLDDVKYIMLCCIPQKNALFQFEFLYLDKNLNIKDYMVDFGFYDYTGFYNKFKKLIVREGFVYELENEPTLKEVTEKFCYSPTTDFGFVVEGKQIKFDDVLVYKDVDLNIFKEDLIDNLKNAGVKDMLLQLDTNPWYANGAFVNFSCKLLDKNGCIIKDYQIKTKFTNVEDYIESVYQAKKENLEKENITKEEWRKEWDEYFTNPDFEFNLTFNYVLSKAEYLSFYKSDDT